MKNTQIHKYKDPIFAIFFKSWFKDINYDHHIIISSYHHIIISSCSFEFCSRKKIAQKVKKSDRLPVPLHLCNDCLSTACFVIEWYSVVFHEIGIAWHCKGGCGID